MTPLHAIRKFCLQCQGDSFQGVTDCNDTACPFHDYRHGVALEKGRHSPVKACRAFFCHDYCQAGAGIEEVRTCGGDKAALGPCPVFPFRMGKNPNKQKPLSEERRAALVENGRKYAFKPGAKPPFTAPESTNAEWLTLNP
jgi:hypothetical protein